MTKTIAAGKNLAGKISGKYESAPRKTKGIIITVIVILAISLLFTASKQLNSRSVNLTAEFSSISDGLNPDSSPFDVQEILSDEVLTEASKKLNGKYSVWELRRHMNITQYTSSLDRITVKNNIREGNDEYISVPTVYRLTYKTISDEIHSEGFWSCTKAIFKHLFSPSKAKVLNAVTESFKDYYVEKYIYTGEALKIDWSKAEHLDYYNKASTTLNIAGRLSRFISDKYNKTHDFISDEETISYGELQNEINSLISVEIENYKSFIIDNGLTKNKTNLLRQFKYMEDYNNETNERLMARYDVIKDAINFYDSDVTKVVFIPALDVNDSFYMNRTKVGIDYLVEQGKTAKIAADDAHHNEINYRHLAEKFSNAPEASDSHYAQADEMFENIKIKIDNFSEKTLKIIAKENKGKKFLDIKVSDTYTGTGIVSAAKQALKTFVLLVLAAYVIIYAYELLKKYRKGGVK